MTSVKQQSIWWVAISATFLILGANVQADSSGTESNATEWKTDFSGKPPFKRTRVAATTAAPTLAAIERAATHRVGAPGKRRSRSRDVKRDLATASLARFEAIETVEQPSQTRRRIGPPGKQNPSLQSKRK